MNFLHETIKILEESGRTPGQIVFIGSERSGHTCTWEEFQTLADFNYDNGFGAQKIPYDLIIVFQDGTRLVRAEYDGSEYWVFIHRFNPPKQRKPINRLVIRDDQVGWESLADVQLKK